MAFLDDLAKLAADAGVGTLGTSIFLSTKSNVPTGAGPYLLIVETGGVAPLRIQTLTTAYRRPSAQVSARAASYAAARAMAEAAYAAMANVVNSTVNGVFYLEIAPIQEPFDLGLDDSKRARVAFNVSAVRRT